MTPLVYFFGNFSNGFKSYPLDYTQQMFSKVLKASKNISQIIFHREDSLAYYSYIREIQHGKCIGISICLDSIITDVKALFDLFDSIYANMVKNGDVLKIDDDAIDWAITDFSKEPVSLTEYTKQISDAVSKSIAKTSGLPPMDYSISINECLDVSLEESPSIIIDAFRRYANVYIAKTNAEIARVTSFFSQLKAKDAEIKSARDQLQEQRDENSTLQDKLTKIEIKQRNTIWVGVLGVVVVIFSFIIWNKVLFPSEVTHYETGEFVYYGPLKDGKPNGVGVAIYPSNDMYGRKYYIGNFVKGNRQDSAAFLFYKDGDYFYGDMANDQWRKGIQYLNSDHSHFKGEFKDNKPYNGTWYEHKKVYKLIDGYVHY